MCFHLPRSSHRRPDLLTEASRGGGGPDSLDAPNGSRAPDDVDAPDEHRDGVATALGEGWSSAPPSLLSPAEQLQIQGIAGVIDIEFVRQRNWSRVAVGTARSTQANGRKVFVKQWIDRVGRPHPRGFAGDMACAVALPDEVAPGIRVVRPLAIDKGRLLAVYPHLDMVTVDALGDRRSPSAEVAGTVGQAMAAIVDHRRLEVDPARVAVWKGLDPKNIGVDEQDGHLWVFDFGPAVDLPVDEAAARCVAAGLLSRWGASPGFHLIRPERSVLRALCAPVAPLTELDLVLDDLDAHAALRRAEPQRSGVAALATRVGLATIGRVHWRAVRREAHAIFGGP